MTSAASPVQYFAASGPPATGAMSDAEAAVLQRINEQVADAVQVEGLIDFLFDSTRDICPCDRIGIAFLEDEGRRVVSHYSRASYEPLLLKPGYAADLQGSSLETTFARRAVRVIHDLEAYLEAKPESAATRLLVREGVRSSMTCPLFVGDERAGLLFRSSRRPGAYSEHQVGLHQAVAGRLSQAVRAAYLIGKLQAANHAYLEMLGFVSHELKSPLASMVMGGELLTEGYLGALTDAQQEKVEAMVAKSRYLLGLVGDYLDLARLEGGQMTITPEAGVDFMRVVVEEALDIVQPQIEEKKIRLHIDAPEALPWTCDPHVLKIVMVNLLSNAVKYGLEGGRVALRVEPRDDRLEVGVWNEGPGFPAELKSNLFRKFSRLKTTELMKRSGSGLGLYTSWRIINLHGGRIWADSAEGEWAEFCFHLPPAPPDLESPSR